MVTVTTYTRRRGSCQWSISWFISFIHFLCCCWSIPINQACPKLSLDRIRMTKPDRWWQDLIDCLRKNDGIGHDTWSTKEWWYWTWQAPTGCLPFWASNDCLCWLVAFSHFFYNNKFHKEIDSLPIHSNGFIAYSFKQIWMEEKTATRRKAPWG